MRFVCDFRGLNDVTKKDNYPLPHIRDVVDKMEGSVFWTTLDAASAYWSMPLDEQDQEKTAFQVPRGKYEFNVTPYGLTNAGASYQGLMDICLSGLPSNRILAYMDDIVIFSRTFNEHISDIRLVFDPGRVANISLKAWKCTFAAETVDFLGELIEKINEKDTAIKTLVDQVNNLEARLAIVEKSNVLLERRCDDLESYTRRQNLRIVGIPEPHDNSETADECIEKVKEEISKLTDVHLNLDQAIDRAHRVGPKKDKNGKPVKRAMIVRFTSWRARTHVYSKRNKGNDNAGARFYVDLTKRRMDLKTKAKAKTANNPKVSFVYGDINNNICLMLPDWTKKFFNSEEELDAILLKL